MPSVVIVGAQWGDEGKGKIIDYLAGESDLVVRAQGGNNAGHTVIVGEKKYSFHLLPSGVLYGDKLNIIGNGVAFDPEGFIAEVDKLEAEGFSSKNIRIDERAHVIFPYHKRIDALEEASRGEEKIGTTQKGIGPCYMDKIQRSGLRVGDLIDPELLWERLSFQVPKKNEILQKLYQSEGYDLEVLYQQYRKYGEKIKKYVTDTTKLTHEGLIADKKVLFEGAQGTLLDLDLGTYPYVTSSHPTAGGFPVGSGIGPNKIQEVLGIVKAYTTRVGMGPFPTELEDSTGEAIRRKGKEFGTTTGRARRCGWLDLVMLKYTARVNGLTGISLMLLDVLRGFDHINVCVEYEVDGKRSRDFPASLKKLGRARPIYQSFPGWTQDLTKVTDYQELPGEAKAYIRFIEEYLEIPVKIVSVGPGRAQTIVREPLYK